MKSGPTARGPVRFGVGWLLVACLALYGCADRLQQLGMELIFEPTEWPAERTVLDLSYVDDAESEPGHTASAHPKHRLDLFLPADPADSGTEIEGEPRSEGDRGWPVLVFVHGGGWTEGDKGHEVGGQDIYGNIGRFYAARGFGVAVVNYRLQPSVHWREQAADVARAVVWLSRHVDRWGGDPERIFLSGHSAGAQLAAWVAVAPDVFDQAERESGTTFDRDRICGVIAVSGAGYDLADEKTYELGAEVKYYERLFRIDPRNEDWQQDGSVVHHLGPPPSVEGLPPFLLAYAADEYPSLRHQAAVFHRRLHEADVESVLVEIPDLGHRRMVLALSQADNRLDDAVIAFLERRAASCLSGEG